MVKFVQRPTLLLVALLIETTSFPFISALPNTPTSSGRVTASRRLSLSVTADHDRGSMRTFDWPVSSEYLLGIRQWAAACQSEMRVSAWLIALLLSYPVLGREASEECREAMEQLGEVAPRLVFRQVSEEIRRSDAPPQPDEDGFTRAQNFITTMVNISKTDFYDPEAAADALVAFWKCRDDYPGQDNKDYLYHLWRPLPIFSDSVFRERVLTLLADRQDPSYEDVRQWTEQMILSPDSLAELQAAIGEESDEDEL